MFIQSVFAGRHTLLKKLFNIRFCYWTCQHAVFWEFADSRGSPTDERYWKDGMEFDDLRNRIKLRRKEVQKLQ